MYDLIRRGTVFISRFSTGLIEAMTLNKPVIYHNPHHEKVDKFQDPLGAFPITDSTASLVQALNEIKKDQPQPATFKNFLDHHAALSMAGLASERSAKAIREILSRGNTVDFETRRKVFEDSLQQRLPEIFPTG
jgi:CDP-glycerol glycerophosphotransferase (TagB/SpsB family)